MKNILLIAGLLFSQSLRAQTLHVDASVILVYKLINK